MSIVPTWPIAVFALALGLGVGVYADHTVMSNRIDKMTVAHAEELRVREVQRAKDEVAAREMERTLTEKIATIEQARTNEIATVRTDANALIERLRNQAASKSASPSGVPKAATSCEATAGGELPESSREDFVHLAQRADELRSALSACYQAYDQVAK